MQARHALHNRQSQARTGVTAAGTLQAFKRLLHARQVLGCNAGAAVGHTQHAHGLVHGQVHVHVGGELRHQRAQPRRVGLRRHYQIAPWSDFVEVHWSPWGEAYVTPVEPDLVGVAILSRHRHDLAWFPWLQRRLAGVPHGAERGCGPLRQVVSRRVSGRVLLVGDAAGYEDALTGEGISLAVKQARAAVAAIVAGRPDDYERDWQRITRRYRWITRGLVLASSPALPRRALVPACAAVPSAFGRAVDVLAS